MAAVAASRVSARAATVDALLAVRGTGAVEVLGALRQDADAGSARPSTQVPGALHSIGTVVARLAATPVGPTTQTNKNPAHLSVRTARAVPLLRAPRRARSSPTVLVTIWLLGIGAVAVTVAVGDANAMTAVAVVAILFFARLARLEPSALS